MLRNRSRPGLITRSIGGGSGEAPPFVPTDISGAIWFDPTYAASINATGSAVNVWTDRGLGAHTATASSTQRPSTGTRTINGLNGLDFNGSLNVMQLSSGMLTLPSGANTVFFVMQDDTTGDANHTLIVGLNATPAGRYGMRTTATTLDVQNRSTSSGFVTQSDARSTSAKIIGFRRSGTSIRSFINGVQGTAGSNAENFTATTMYIGSATSGGLDRFDGIMGDIIMYPSYLSDADMDRVGNFLTRWGVAWTNINF